MMCIYTFFSKDPSQWDESYQSLWGCHDICPLLRQFHITQVTQPGLSSLTHLWVWGGLWKILQWYGISVGIAQRGCCRREGVWAHCGVGSPLSSQGSHFRWGGKKTHLTHLFRLQLALQFCAFQWGCLSCPFPKGGSLKCHDWWDT